MLNVFSMVLLSLMISAQGSSPDVFRREFILNTREFTLIENFIIYLFNLIITIYISAHLQKQNEIEIIRKTGQYKNGSLLFLHNP